MSNPVADENRFPTRVLLAADTLFARVYHNLKVIAPLRIPTTGPAILISNHTSSIDPAFIQSVCRNRLITWMMAAEYLEMKSMGWLFKAVGVIPVQRSGRDSAPLRAAIRALQRGAVLGIFPEGKISDHGDLLPFQTGAALLAIKTKAPVFPVFLSGSQRGKGMVRAAFQRNCAKIAFGPELIFTGGTTHEELEAATSQMRSAVNDLAQAVNSDIYCD